MTRASLMRWPWIELHCTEMRHRMMPSMENWMIGCTRTDISLDLTDLPRAQRKTTLTQSMTTRNKCEVHIDPKTQI